MPDIARSRVACRRGPSSSETRRAVLLTSRSPRIDVLFGGRDASQTRTGGAAAARRCSARSGSRCRQVGRRGNRVFGPRQPGQLEVAVWLRLGAVSTAGVDRGVRLRLRTDDFVASTGTNPMSDSRAASNSGLRADFQAALCESRPASSGPTRSVAKAVMNGTGGVSPTTRRSPFLIVPQPSSSGAA